jgi:hypothetical protein
MKEIYIVTDGDYSDYHIIGVWESRKKAQSWVKEYKRNNEWNWGDPRIEEWPLEDDPEFAEFRRATALWCVEMTEAGDVKSCYELPHSDSSPAELRAPARSGWANAGFFFFEGVATDKEHAIKIAAERWAEWKWKKEQKKAQKKARAK